MDTKAVLKNGLWLVLTSATLIATSACAAGTNALAVNVKSQQTLSVDDARHLLSRTGIGVSPTQLKRYSQLTRHEAIDSIMADFKTQPDTDMPDWVNQPLPHYHARADMSANDRALFNNERDSELAQLKQWWTLEMLQTSSPQTERMVVFWHDVFATSYYDTDHQSLAMARQNQTFRRLGMGSWSELLKAMIRDSALLEFLNAGSNHKDSPNENLARELLELFTLGEGNYSEFTVKEAARALTGHDTERSHNLAFYVKTWQQDRGVKNLFGISAPHTGDDLIDQILKQPEAARYLSTRFWNAYISDAEPDPAWLDHIARVFRESNYQIRVLYKEMLASDAFWSAEHRGAMIKSPVDIIVGTSRSLEYPKYLWHQVSGWLASLDMELFAPPNVSGWSEGGAYVTPGRLLNRIKVVDDLVFTSAATDQLHSVQAMNPMMSANGQQEARVKVRLAAEDYQGPVRYQVELFNARKPLWRGPETVFKFGHDTEKLGRLGNRNDAAWVTEAVEAPKDLIDQATHMTVSFLNDAAGPGGDRNLYVDGVEVDKQWFSSTRAKQTSACEPDLAADSGRLYCEGSLRFSIKPDAIDEVIEQPVWSASAVHVEWARHDISTEFQSAYITLDHFKTPDRYFHNFQFGLISSGQEPIRLQVDTFGCWPSCVSMWPECSWVDEHFSPKQTLAFPLRAKSDSFWSSNDNLACHRSGLEASDRRMIDVLWHNAATLLVLADKTPRAARFEPTLKKMLKKLNTTQVSLGESIYSQTAPANINVDARYLPNVRPRSTLAADMPAISSLDELTNALSESSISLSSLLVPDVPGINLSNASLDTLVKNPAFQIK